MKLIAIRWAKSGAEAAAVQALRAVWPSRPVAKRLDCVRFTAAFLRVTHGKIRLLLSRAAL